MSAFLQKTDRIIYSYFRKYHPKRINLIPLRLEKKNTVYSIVLYTIICNYYLLLFKFCLQNKL